MTDAPSAGHPNPKRPSDVSDCGRYERLGSAWLGSTWRSSLAKERQGTAPSLTAVDTKGLAGQYVEVVAGERKAGKCGVVLQCVFQDWLKIIIPNELANHVTESRDIVK